MNLPRIMTTWYAFLGHFAKKQHKVFIHEYTGNLYYESIRDKSASYSVPTQIIGILRSLYLQKSTIHNIAETSERKKFTFDDKSETCIHIYSSNPSTLVDNVSMPSLITNFLKLVGNLRCIRAKFKSTLVYEEKRFDLHCPK